MTGIGPVPVRAPRVRDRVGQGETRVRFASAILPSYARRSKSLEELIPILLRGLSSGDFAEALRALLGKDAGGLSGSTIARPTDVWSDEYQQWQKRDLSAKRYVYLWADGIHVQARLEDAAQCLLVIIGATPEGKKEFVGLTDGVRESAVLARATARSAASRPRGRAQACGCRWRIGILAGTRGGMAQRCGQPCWVHKTANVLNKLPKSQQPKASHEVEGSLIGPQSIEALRRQTGYYRELKSAQISGFRTANYA